MNTLEIVIVVAFVLIILLCLYFAFFSKKKKNKEKKESGDKKDKGKNSKKEKEPAGERKVEKAIKKPGEEEKQEAKQESEEKEKTLEKEPPKEKEGFKIIRKQSKIKINKKAINASSRNPSITKVFDKNGKILDSKEEAEGNVFTEETASEIVEIQGDNKGVMSDIHSQNIDRFGFREPQIETTEENGEYKINAPIGSPNRAPIIGDRTNFASHLNISADGNLSGVVGTGVAKIIEKAEKQSDDIEKKTNDMLENIRRNILGDRPFNDPYNMGARIDRNNVEEKGKSKTIKDFDVKTLILADAINNPKSKKTQK